VRESANTASLLQLNREDPSDPQNPFNKMDQSETPEKIYISELSQVDTKDSEAAREHDKIIERRLLWKIDLRILPILTLLYIFAAMDRSDLGNAQVAGMQADLGATSKQWTLVASLFYVGYIVAQPIGTLYLRRISPPIIFSFACCIWGVSARCPLLFFLLHDAILSPMNIEMLNTYPNGRSLLDIPCLTNISFFRFLQYLC
jgi:hypothetical protein